MTYRPTHIRLTRHYREGDEGEQIVSLVSVCLRCGCTSEPISNNATLARDEMDEFIGGHEMCSAGAA